MLREVLTRQISKSGMIVCVSADSRHAIGIIQSAAPIDLLITDYSMPGMPGDELIAAAHAIRPNLPVILLTGHPYEAAEFVRHYNGPGNIRVTSKPASGRDILDAIGLLLTPVRADPTANVNREPL